MSLNAAVRRRKRLLVLGSSLLISLVLAELGVRVEFGTPLTERLPLMMMRANSQRGWEMVPGQAHYTYQERVEVNSLGLRGPEVGVKAPGERRVLFLGDSLVYGQGLADDQTLPAALERALRRRDPGQAWTVVNAGNRAYDTPQELALLAELGGRIRPDIVLLGWYWNDLNEHSIQQMYDQLKDKGELAFDTHDRLEGWDRLAWQARQLTRSSALAMLLHDLLSSQGVADELESAQQGLPHLGRHLDSLRESCARLGAVPVLVIFPDSHLLIGQTKTRAFDERASALARERGLPVVELLPALEPLHARGRRPPILPFDGHYDAEANAAMGELLAGQLLVLALDPEQRDE